MRMVHDFLLIFLPLFVVVDPAGTVPVFLAMTACCSEAQRRRIASRATLVAAATGILFIIAGQAIFSFLGIHFGDFQIAGGILVAILAIVDLLTPGKPAVNDKIQIDPAANLSVVPLAVPLIVGPATMATSLLLVNTYSPPYNDALGKPWGEFLVITMVCVALMVNLAILFAAMYRANRLAELIGKNTMEVINKIVMILLMAFAVSLIRQGIMSIVAELPRR